MSRQEFMERLKKLLNDIPASERSDALNYYENYFEDAGPEKEAQIIEELESPEKVAASIKKDLFGENYNEYEYMNHEKNQQKTQEYNAKVQRNILIALFLFFTCPIWGGLLIGLFGVIIGLFGAVLGIGAAFIACVAVFYVMGCVFIGIGIIKTVSGFPAIGLIILGVGMLFLALGIVGTIALAWALGKFIPWTVRTIVDIGTRLLNRFRGKEAL